MSPSSKLHFSPKIIQIRLETVILEQNDQKYKKRRFSGTNPVKLCNHLTRDSELLPTGIGVNKQCICSTIRRNILRPNHFDSPGLEIFEARFATYR